MNRKSIAVYSIVISIVFAAALLFFGGHIVTEYRHGGERTRRTFSRLSSSAEKDLSPELFARAAESGDYAAFSVYVNGDPAYIFPDETAGRVRDTPMIKIYRTTIVSGSDVCEMTAALYLLRPASIFYYARFSFIVILTGVLLTVVLIIYLSVTDGKSAGQEANAADGRELPPDGDGTEYDSGNIRPDSEYGGGAAESVAADADGGPGQDNAAGLPDAESAAERAAAMPQDAESAPSHDDSEAASGGAERGERMTDGGNAPRESDGKNAEPPQEGGIRNMFSPVTGFCREQDLQIRLDSEIARAAASEQDLSLIIIRIPGLSYTDAIVPQLCECLLREFQFRDMIFEYKGDGFAVIRIDTSIESAETQADSVQAGITRLTADSGKKCFIGISSRSIRMLSAERLIAEASEAMRHASEDGNSQTISFHVDIEKYREFIQK